FGADPKASDYRPHHHIQNSVVYTATHDHNTTVGWFTSPAGQETTQTEDEIADERRHVLQYIGADDSEIHWKFMRMAMGSVGRLCVFPMQDVLGLGAQYRMNRPGTTKGNWEWRLRDSDLTSGLAKRLLDLTTVFGRCSPSSV